ncbi:MAG: hypothetical protein Q9169_006877 [Polycauliona sp. 2 TL-2023]
MSVKVNALGARLQQLQAVRDARPDDNITGQEVTAAKAQFEQAKAAMKVKKKEARARKPKGPPNQGGRPTNRERFAHRLHNDGYQVASQQLQAEEATSQQLLVRLDKARMSVGAARIKHQQQLHGNQTVSAYVKASDARTDVPREAKGQEQLAGDHVQTQHKPASDPTINLESLPGRSTARYSRWM